MQNPNSSLDRLKPIEENLNDQTLLLASHGGKTSKLPLAKLKTFVGGGSGGGGDSGFIFEDLAEHVVPFLKKSGNQVGMLLDYYSFYSVCF